MINSSIYSGYRGDLNWNSILCVIATNIVFDAAFLFCYDLKEISIDRAGIYHGVSGMVFVRKRRRDIKQCVQSEILIGQIIEPLYIQGPFKAYILCSNKQNDKAKYSNISILLSIKMEHLFEDRYRKRNVWASHKNA